MESINNNADELESVDITSHTSRDSDCFAETLEEAYDKGYCDGYKKGYEKGYKEGYKKGCKDGYERARQEVLDYIEKNRENCNHCR